MSDSILERLKDLAKQATTERSHFYVKKTCVDAYGEITDLEAKLKIAAEALEFYGNKRNWGTYPGDVDSGENAMLIVGDKEHYSDVSFGHRAREALQKIRGE